MTVEYTPEDVGHRFVHIRARHQNAENARYIAGTAFARPRALGKAHDLVSRRGWMSAQCGQFTRGHGNFAMGLGKSGDGIREKQNMPTLVPKMLCDGHGRQGAATTFERRTI